MADDDAWGKTCGYFFDRVFFPVVPQVFNLEFLFQTLIILSPNFHQKSAAMTNGTEKMKTIEWRWGGNFSVHMPNTRQYNLQGWTPASKYILFYHLDLFPKVLLFTTVFKLRWRDYQGITGHGLSLVTLKSRPFTWFVSHSSNHWELVCSWINNRTQQIDTNTRQKTTFHSDWIMW